MAIVLAAVAIGSCRCCGLAVVVVSPLLRSVVLAVAVVAVAVVGFLTFLDFWCIFQSCYLLIFG